MRGPAHRAPEGTTHDSPEHQHLPFYWNAALLKLGDLLAKSGA
ncbi:hypothetical protein [Deinococcus sp.]|nr:hypothetical protein [Deinococcus sp.]